MLEFFKILFLAKSVLLTSSFITINDQLLLKLDDSVSAISSGASLEINVSSMFEGVGIKELGIIESRKVLKDYFSQGSVEADLIGEDENIVISLDIMSFSLEDAAATLVLSSAAGVPTGVNINRIKIRASVPLNKVTITWKNFSK
jgi:hypothetical protein